VIFLIDNYDSFTYNILHLAARFAEVKVVSRDELWPSGEEPSGLILSAGPGRPTHGLVEMVRRYGGRVPILGICLGMQAIAQAYGGHIVRAERVMQGKVSKITHTGEGLFAGAASPMEVGRYHSLMVERESVPSCFKIDAQTEEGVIMALSHTHHCVYGVQFHPESILTHHGEVLMRNFMQQVFHQGER